MKYLFSLLLIASICVSNFAQRVGFGIVPAKRTITNQEISTAKVLTDINPKYEASWVREYISVEITVKSQGEKQSASGKSFELNKDQLTIVQNAPTGSDITVVVQYYPNNNLPPEVQKMNFTMSVAPDKDAEFIGGRDALTSYLEENALGLLTAETADKMHEVIVSFQVQEDGTITNTEMNKYSHLACVEEVLTSAINNMPTWEPAKNSDGTIVTQSFDFIVSKDQCVNKTLSLYSYEN